MPRQTTIQIYVHIHNFDFPEIHKPRNHITFPGALLAELLLTLIQQKVDFRARWDRFLPAGFVSQLKAGDEWIVIPYKDVGKYDVPRIAKIVCVMTFEMPGAYQRMTRSGIRRKKRRWES